MELNNSCAARSQIDRGPPENTQLENAVLKAADDWLTALEKQVAARHFSKDTEPEQETLELAEVKLVRVVMELRRSRVSSHSAGEFLRRSLR